MPASSAGDRQSERVLGGRYRLVRHLATGGMAEVWEAHDALLARDVAVKLPLAHLARQGSFPERFRREAVAAARLSHPNVVAVYDTGTDGGDSYIVMELVRGPSLRRLLASDQPVVVERAVSIAAQVAGALDFAHRAGVVHRDIKPGNILLGPEGVVKVTDFGIAKAAMGEDLTATDTTLGTVRYIAPELVESKAPDGRSDIYSLGIVLYELLCGRTPFDGEAEVAVALKHVRELPHRPSEEGRSEVPGWLDEVVLRCLEKDPAQRFSTAGELRSSLLAGLDGRSPLSGGAGATDGAVKPRSSPSPPVEVLGRGLKSAGATPQAAMIIDSAPTTVRRAGAEGADATTRQPRPDTRTPPGRGSPAASGPRDPTRTISLGDRARDEDRSLAPQVTPSREDEWPSGWGEPETRRPEERDRGVDSHRGDPRTSTPRRRMVPLVAAIVVVAALGTAVGVLVSTAHHGSAPPAQPSPPAAAPIPIASAQAFDPYGDGVEDNADLPKLIDGNPSTFWSTDIYDSQQFGNLKPGVGFVLVLSSSARLGHLSIISPTPGWDANIYVAANPESSLAAYGRPVATVTGAAPTVSVNLRGASGGAVLVWFTHLGLQDRVEVGEASLTS